MGLLPELLGLFDGGGHFRHTDQHRIAEVHTLLRWFGTLALFQCSSVVVASSLSDYGPHWPDTTMWYPYYLACCWELADVDTGLGHVAPVAAAHLQLTDADL